MAPLSRQANYEKQWLEKEMRDFAPFESEAWALLTSLYGSRISKPELESLGQVVARELQIDLVREYRRRKETMIKWFQNHITILRPFLQNDVDILGENDIVLWPMATAHSTSG
jgi:hypothetical protein